MHERTVCTRLSFLLPTSEPGNETIDWSALCYSHYYVIGILNSEPKLHDLLEEIAAAIPAKWEEVGYALRIERERMDQIKHETMKLSSTATSYCEVFSHWLKNTLEHQRTWNTVLNALATKLVGEEQLARKITRKIIQKEVWISDFDCHFCVSWSFVLASCMAAVWFWFMWACMRHITMYVKALSLHSWPWVS